MIERTLYLAWQDKESSRKWYPVGRLDTDIERPLYRFRYTRGAERAVEEVGFPLALDFPEIREDYRASELFPLFRNRIIAPRRPDRRSYLNNLDLPQTADPIEILSANGGRRVTDWYEVFPKIEKRADRSFSCRFFLHGARYTNPAAQQRLAKLEPNEKLYLTLELTNPTGTVALQVQTMDYFMIGWAPRYLVHDLTAAMVTTPGKYKAHVVRINPQPAPSRQRVFIEMTGDLGSHEPMTSHDFIPLVRDK